MGRKKIMTKLLTCFAAAATVATGILGSVPLPARAAEEDSYTVTFEAYEGICETEAFPCQRGKASYCQTHPMRGIIWKAG